MKISLSIPLATVVVLLMTLIINIIGLRLTLDRHFPEYLAATQAQIRQQIDISPDKLQALFAINSLDNSTQEDYQTAINELSNISNSLESLSKNPELYIATEEDNSAISSTGFQIHADSTQISLLEQNISTTNILSILSHPFSFDKNSAEGKFIGAVLINFVTINAFWILFITILYLIWIRRMFRPIHIIINSLKNFSTQKTENILYKKTDEFRPLVDTINQMHDSLEKQERIRSQFLSDLSHEIRTPMTAISCLLEAIDDGIMTLDKNTIITLQNEMRRLVKIAEHIMKSEDFLSEKNNSTQKVLFAVKPIFSEIIHQYEPQLQKKNQKIFEKIPEWAELLANTEQFIQILHNIFSNFYKYAWENSALECCFSKNKKSTTITFIDNGKGILPEDLPFVTEKFFQSDSARTQNVNEMSMGIGLSLVEKIIKIHNGKLELKPNSPQWLIIIITFFHHE